MGQGQIISSRIKGKLFSPSVGIAKNRGRDPSGKPVVQVNLAMEEAISLGFEYEAAE